MTPADAALQELLLLAARRHMLTRAVLSKPRQAGEKKTVLTLRRVGQAERLQAERFLTDGKALHENLPPGPSPRLEELLTSHGQINLLPRPATASCAARSGPARQPCWVGTGCGRRCWGPTRPVRASPRATTTAKTAS